MTWLDKLPGFQRSPPGTVNLPGAGLGFCRADT